MRIAIFYLPGIRGTERALLRVGEPNRNALIIRIRLNPKELREWSIYTRDNEKNFAEFDSRPIDLLHPAHSGGDTK